MLTDELKTAICSPALIIGSLTANVPTVIKNQKISINLFGFAGLTALVLSSDQLIPQLRDLIAQAFERSIELISHSSRRAMACVHLLTRSSYDHRLGEEPTPLMAVVVRSAKGDPCPTSKRLRRSLSPKTTVMP